MPSIPKGALVEIVEKRKSEDPIGIVVPNEVRLNGEPLLCSSDYPVVVHEVSTLGNDAVYVTLTLIARRVEFKQEVEV
ncbi:MAG: hypothetical protein ACXVGC_00120 [Mycobacteriaceae bacterium]